MKFSVFQASRIGGREKNEDRMGYCYTSHSGLFVLADGMGGHPEGEVAAQMAIQTISSLYQKEARPTIADVPIFFKVAVMAAHRQILRYAAEHKMSDTPRTTLVAAIVQDGSISWVHCGDSRLYFVRQGELVVRTLDHSYLEMQKKTQNMAGLPANFNRNVLYTCLGAPDRPVFDISDPMILEQGDKILLCSDGLWGTVDDADIALQLDQLPLTDAATSLLEKALTRGGSHCDNVTLIAVEWETPSVFASTVRLGWLDEPATNFDDAAIEQSIAEINETIRRVAERKP